MDFEMFGNLVPEYFGYKLTFHYLDHDTKSVYCVLYDSFAFNLSIGNRYGVFGASIWLGDSKHRITNVLGKEISLNSDYDSIKLSLELVDTYCRLRLPDKFLVEFDKLK